MPPSDLDPNANDTAALAATLIRTFGERARSMAEAQAKTDADLPEVARKWLDVAKAVSVLSQASLHMEMALELLDSVGELPVAARLDHAIAELGFRPSPSGGSATPRVASETMRS